MPLQKEKYDQAPEEDIETSISTSNLKVEEHSLTTGKLRKKYAQLCPRRRLYLLSAAILTLAIVLLIIYFLHKSRKEDPEPQFYRQGVAKDPRRLALCKLGDSLKKNCLTTDMAESLDYVYAFNPYYSYPNTEDSIRFMHHINAQDYLLSFGAKCVVVEGIYAKDGQTAKLKEYNRGCQYFLVELEDYMYYRENLVNVYANKLIDEWEVLLLIDSHQVFSNQYWLLDTIWATAHYKTVQLFHDFVKLNEDNSTRAINKASLAHYEKVKYPKGNAGNAWALEKEVWTNINYLPDKCITGLCDTCLAYAAVSSPAVPFEEDMFKWGPNASHSPYLLYSIVPWIRDAKKYLNGSQTYLKTTLYHFEHEHHFNWTSMGHAIDKCGYDADSLARDETLFLRLTSPCIQDYMKEYYDFFSSADRISIRNLFYTLLIFFIGIILI